MEEEYSAPLAVLRWQGQRSTSNAIYLHKGETIEIGRLERNDLTLSNPRVSRQHAVLVWRDSAFQIKDLRSVNGTFVNGTRITAPHILQDGDTIAIDEEPLHFYQLGGPKATADRSDFEGDTIMVPEKNRHPRLVVSSGEQEGRQIMLHTQTAVIGRATDKDDWDIDLQDKSISRPHAEISDENGRFMITDLSSANGTLVNGDWISEPVALENGDVIELGETILVFRN